MEATINFILFALVAGLPPLARAFFSVKEAPEATVTERQPFFDYLKGLAMLAVIWIHVRHVYEKNVLGNDFAFLNISNDLLRFAIPVFLICSGLLLNPTQLKNNTFSFYFKKIFRIFIPYVLVNLMVVSAIRRMDLLPELLFTGAASVPYYFVLVLFQCYLIYPLLVLFEKHKQLLLIGSFFVSLLSFLFDSTWYIHGFPTVFQYLFFFVYGFCMRNYFLNNIIQKKELYVWLTIIFANIVFVAVTKPMLYNAQFFYGVAMFNLFFIFKDLLMKNKSISKLLVSIGSRSLWIYLLHFFIVQMTFGALYSRAQNYYLVFILIFIVSTIVSIVVGYTVDRIYTKALTAFFPKGVKRV